MSKSQNKEANAVLIIAGVLVVFVAAVVIARKMFKALNTESPVLDETSKKILSDKKLVEDYYEAIEKEKKGQTSDITIEGEKYEVIRAGKYHQPVTAD